MSLPISILRKVRDPRGIDARPDMAVLSPPALAAIGLGARSRAKIAAVFEGRG